MKRFLRIAVFACSAALAAPVMAQDFDAGLEAADAGDFKTALEIWEPLAEQGDADAQYWLGLMYAAGQNVTQDDAKAVHWYRLAAEQEVAKAQRLLGIMYAIGQGVLQDKVLAHMWLNISKANGDTLGGEHRDGITQIMTPEQIADAEARARVCMGSGYQDCD